jgi:hypothetical protein
LDFGIEKSIRYHQRRQAHYARLHQAFVFLIIISGSAAFTQVLPPDWLGAAAAALAIWDLVARYSDKARDHAVLQKRYTDIAADMRTASAPTEEQIGQWERRRIEIETEEPKIMQALEAWCDNEVRFARGLENQGIVSLKWRHRHLKDWISFSSTNFRLEKPIRGVADDQRPPEAQVSATGA